MDKPSQSDCRPAPAPTTPAHRRPLAPAEWRLFAMIGVVLLHVAVLALIVARHQELAPLTPVAMLMAYCSLGGIWWTRTRWPSHVKTLVAVLGWLAIFAMMLMFLHESRGEADRAAGWAASLATQFVLISLATRALELRFDMRRAVAGHRFTILTLLIWTTMIGCVLGGGRWLAAWLGWTAENFFAWEYFQQLQVLAIANAALAFAVVASLRLPRSWLTRCAASCLTVLFAVPLTVTMMWWIFGSKVGLSLPELACLAAIEGLILVVTLVPLELGRERHYISK